MPLILIDHDANQNAPDTIWKLTLDASYLHSTPSPERDPENTEPQDGHCYFLHADNATRAAWNTAFETAIRHPVDPTRNFDARLVHISVGGAAELPAVPLLAAPHDQKIVNFALTPNDFEQELRRFPAGELAMFINVNIRPLV